MALINCPECGRSVSDAADNCPECGYPIKKEKDIFESGVQKMSSANKEKDFLEAAELFKSVIRYSNAAELSEQCMESVEKCRIEAQEKKEKTKKVGTRIAIYGGSFVAVAVIAFLVIFKLIPTLKYNHACELLNGEQYEEAELAFEAMGDYKDCLEKKDYSHNQGLYVAAEKALEEGDYASALGTFNLLGDYSDSRLRCKDTAYKHAEYYVQTGNYEAAIQMYQTVPDYKDASEKVLETKYLLGKEKFNNGDYSTAGTIFMELKDYSDSAEYFNESRYLIANVYFSEKDYYNASLLYRDLSDYKDSNDLYSESQYQYALACVASGDYENALNAFPEGYKDSDDQIPEVKYQYALQLFSQAEYQKASNLFKELGKYNDSAKQYKESYYQYGIQLRENGQLPHAVNVFTELDGYSDSTKLKKETMYQYAQEHLSSSDKKTYEYLRELKRISYSDAKKLYDEYFGWKLEIFFNNSVSDTSKKSEYVSIYDVLACHFKITGGPSYIYSVNVKTIWTCPNSADQQYYVTAGIGNYECVYLQKYTPSLATGGTVYISLYDDTTGDYIGSSAVYWG